MERDEVIKGLYQIKNWKCNGDAEMHEVIESAIKLLEHPTIQPEEHTDKRTETHACDSKAMMYTMKCMEEKLRELMGKESYTEFATKIAKEAFRLEAESMTDSEFKEMMLATFDDIVAEQDKPYIALADALYVARESEK